MATCGNERLLFIHVPKTGGTWVKRAMEAGGITVSQERASIHPPIWELDRQGRFSFAFVRDPLAWWGSEWKFRRFHGYKEFRDHPYDRWLDLGFDRFLERVVEECPGYLSRVLDDLLGQEGDSLDFIGRYENLTEDLVKALRFANESFDEEALRSVSTTNESGDPVWVFPWLLKALQEAERPAYTRFYPELLEA
jgi:hypothetical protein